MNQLWEKKYGDYIHLDVIVQSDVRIDFISTVSIRIGEDFHPACTSAAKLNVVLRILVIHSEEKFRMMK